MEEQITVVRSRRRTICLMLGKAGEIVVRAPYGVSREQISTFVGRHEKWIRRRRAERECVPRFAIGDEVMLFGKRYVLAEGKPRIAGETIYLPETDPDPAFERILKKMVLEYLTERTRSIAQAYCFRYSTVRISSARTRWGSCNAKGNINYSFRTAFLPADVAEYVVVHELCHTRHLDHSAAFWREVKNILPDYPVRRARLKNYAVFMQAFSVKSV